MPDIVRDGWIVELNGPPCFEYGQKVRSNFVVRNDGTFPGKEIGEVLGVTESRVSQIRTQAISRLRTYLPK